MLEMKKGKGDAPAGLPLIKIQEGKAQDSPHLTISTAWYRQYAKETGIMIGPRADDHKAALELYRAVSGDLSGLDSALEAYFGRFRELDLWFAAKKTSRTGDRSAWVPDWSFRTFVARYPEIVATAMEKVVQAEGKKDSGAAASVRTEPLCPVCGSRPLGTLASCPTCGLDWGDSHNEAKVSEHGEWWTERRAGKRLQLNLGSLIFRSEGSAS